MVSVQCLVQSVSQRSTSIGHKEWDRRHGDYVSIHTSLWLDVSERTTLRQVKSILARKGALTFTTPPHRVRVWIPAVSFEPFPRNRVFPQALSAFLSRFKLVPVEDETQTLAAAGFAGNHGVMLLEIDRFSQHDHFVQRIAPPIQRTVGAALRRAKLLAVARERSAELRETDLDGDALGGVLLRLGHRGFFGAARRVCRFWALTASAVLDEWRALHLSLGEVRGLPAESTLLQRWLALHPEIVDDADLATLVDLHAPDSLQVRRLRRKPREGVKLPLTGGDGSPLHAAPLLALLGNPEQIDRSVDVQQIGALLVDLGSNGGRQVQAAVVIQPHSRSHDVVMHGEQIVGYTPTWEHRREAAQVSPLANKAETVEWRHRRGEAILNVWGNVNWSYDQWMPSVVALPFRPKEPNVNPVVDGVCMTSV